MDPSTVSAAGVSTAEALIYIGTAISSVIAGIGGHKYYAGKSKPGSNGTNGATNGRLDALAKMATSFDAFAQSQRDFTVHVAEQHSHHAEALKNQTAILGKISETLAGCKVLLESKR